MSEEPGFYFWLASHLHGTVSELRSALSAEELAEWRALALVEPPRPPRPPDPKEPL